MFREALYMKTKWDDFMEKEYCNASIPKKILDREK